MQTHFLLINQHINKEIVNTWHRINTSSLVKPVGFYIIFIACFIFQVLKDFVQSCLQETQDKGLTGIAFPAIGTGNLGYPRDVVAQEMFQAVVDFEKQNSRTSIQKVVFVLYPQDTQTISVSFFLTCFSHFFKKCQLICV